VLYEGSALTRIDSSAARSGSLIGRVTLPLSLQKKLTQKGYEHKDEKQSLRAEQ